jgi:hypothetical protein
MKKELSKFDDRVKELGEDIENTLIPKMLTDHFKI